jgi:transcriptional regulator with XRE-family HTH domain
MVDRIKQILEFYNLSPALFAEQIGINRSNLTHLFSGRNQPSLDLAKKILHCYPDIKTEWLIMGVGEMFRNNIDKELQIQIQNERSGNTENLERDLFSSVPVSGKKITAGESRIAEKKEIADQICDSREVEEKTTQTINKHVENEPLLPYPTPQIHKIVFFYSDNSFEIYHSTKK